MDVNCKPLTLLNFVVIYIDSYILSLYSRAQGRNIEMRKIFATLCAGACAFSLVACASQNEEVTVDTKEEATEEVTEATGVYTIYNTTGEKVTDLYVYEVGSSDKGENKAGDGLADGDSVKVEYTAMSDATLVLEFTMESGETKAFETLHIEEAPISLLSEDTMTGATPISFAVPE